MKRFARLFTELDTTTKTSEKVAALAAYFGDAAPADAAWAVHVLSGRKISRLVPTPLLRRWAAEQAAIPNWLFDESHDAVGDLAETLALIVPPGRLQDDAPLSHWIEQRLIPLRKMDEPEQRAALVDLWNRTEGTSRFLLMKLITGSFRVGVSARLVTRGLAQQSGLPAEVIAHRLMGDWQPSAAFFRQLTSPDTGDALLSQPYPFCLAHAIAEETGPSVLGPATQYFAEWKWDGIRGQVVRRRGETFIWSRGEELMENRWPEIEADAAHLPDGTVLDGEILASRGPGEVLPFAQLQRRIGRKRVGKKLLQDVPVIFHAFDLLESGGEDIRNLPFTERRRRLEALLQPVDLAHLVPTVPVPGEDWETLARVRETSREQNAEGLMLKRKDSPYDVGRVRGTWWKWKIAPYTIDAVLIYAQRGHGKRASLYTDYTFALWHEGELVPFAKAYSGLSDAEIRRVDAFVRRNTKDRFGPVRSVEPTLVMELAFEGLQRSSRHKSGVATRFPRILRWREDKQPKDANSLDELLELLPTETS